MRTIAPILLVLIAAYGAALAVKPQLAVRRADAGNAVKLNIARFKGILAFGLSAFMLWRLLG